MGVFHLSWGAGGAGGDAGGASFDGFTEKEPKTVFIGLDGGKIQFTGMENYTKLEDWDYGRPMTQWWMDLRPIARILAQPAPK